MLVLHFNIFTRVSWRTGLLFILIFLIFPAYGFSQDRNYARKIIDSLGSSFMAGRGYVDQGDNKAATYIASEFGKFQLKSFGKTYFQKLHFPMNTFPGKVLLKAEDVSLEAGVDFVVNSNVKPVKGNFKLVYMLDTSLTWDKLRQKTMIDDFKGKILVISKYLEPLHWETLPNIKGIVVLSNKTPSWSVSHAFETQDFLVIECRLEKFPQYAKSIDIDIESEFVKKYRTVNVIGYIKGSLKPDSFIVFTAHYDHLGKLGKNAWFPGANDNASGTAMMIDLAKYYSTIDKKLEYSIVFIAFAGEEAGLKGSLCFSEHPLVPLNRIRFVINLDMMGTGVDGIKVVNGSIFKKEFDLLTSINKEKSFIKDVSVRGESKNSDHYPFYKNGVPAFFIYSLDENYKEYHNLNDRPEKLPMTSYNGIFRLLTEFVSAISKN